MAKMEELIRQSKCHKLALEEIVSKQSEAVWRVLRVFDKITFRNDTFNYARESATHTLIGNHLWPQCFEDFTIHQGELSAGGMYSGARGYYESESVRFPAAWLDLEGDALEAAMMIAWEEHLAKIEEQRRAEERKNEDRERALLEELQKKYN